MHVLVEEDGAFKTATILTDNEASLQVEMASGKRAKIKSANVLLRYVEPAPGKILVMPNPWPRESSRNFFGSVRAMANFLLDFADDYFEGTGHKATSLEATALLLALHSAPIYFHRKGEGRFRKAPPDILAAALAGLEKKRQQALAIERMVGELEGLHAAAGVPAAAQSTALQARSQSLRNQGTGSRLRRDRSVHPAPAGEMWRHSFGLRLPPTAFSVRALPARHRISRHRDSFATRRLATRRCSGLLDRRCGNHRD